MYLPHVNRTIPQFKVYAAIYISELRRDIFTAGTDLHSSFSDPSEIRMFFRLGDDCFFELFDDQLIGGFSLPMQLKDYLFEPGEYAIVAFNSSKLQNDPPSDVYTTIGVSPTISDLDLRRQYRKQSLRVHPDKKYTAAEKEVATQQFQHLRNCYDAVSQRTQRLVYSSSSCIECSAGGGDFIGRFNRYCVRCLNETGKSDTYTPLDLIVRGGQCSATHDAPYPLLICRPCIDNTHNNVQARIKRGFAAMNKQEFSTANEIFDEIKSRLFCPHPLQGDLFSGAVLARIACNLGTPDAIIQELEHARVKQPENVDLISELAARLVATNTITATRKAYTLYDRAFTQTEQTRYLNARMQCCTILQEALERNLLTVHPHDSLCFVRAIDTNLHTHNMSVPGRVRGLSCLLQSCFEV